MIIEQQSFAAEHVAHGYNFLEPPPPKYDHPIDTIFLRSTLFRPLPPGPHWGAYSAPNSPAVSTRPARITN